MPAGRRAVDFVESFPKSALADGEDVTKAGNLQPLVKTGEGKRFGLRDEIGAGSGWRYAGHFCHSRHLAMDAHWTPHELRWVSRFGRNTSRRANGRYCPLGKTLTCV